MPENLTRLPAAGVESLTRKPINVRTGTSSSPDCLAGDVAASTR